MNPRIAFITGALFTLLMVGVAFLIVNKSGMIKSDVVYVKGKDKVSFIKGKDSISIKTIWLEAKGNIKPVSIDTTKNFALFEKTFIGKNDTNEVKIKTFPKCDSLDFTSLFKEHSIEKIRVDTLKMLRVDTVKITLEKTKEYQGLLASPYVQTVAVASVLYTIVSFIK